MIEILYTKGSELFSIRPLISGKTDFKDTCTYGIANTVANERDTQTIADANLMTRLLILSMNAHNCQQGSKNN